MAATCCRLDADSQAVGPDDAADLLVSCGLCEELSEADIRSEGLRIQVQFQAVVDAFVCVEYVISRISNPHGGNGRKACVQILSWDEFRNQQVRQSGLCVCIAEEKILRAFFVQRSLKLESTLTLPGIENGIFLTVIGGRRQTRGPVRPSEVWSLV